MSRPNYRPPATAPRSRPGWQAVPCLLLVLLGASAPTLAGDGVGVSVNATLLSKSNCKFQGSSTPALAFGNINPASNTPATASASLTIRCGGAAPIATYTLNHDSGLYGTGPNAKRMKHATLNAYLPYTFTLTPASGSVAKNTNLTITVAGTVSPTSFQDAVVGSYSDTVVVTLNP